MRTEDRSFLRKVLRFSLSLSFFFIGFGLTQPVMSLYTAGFVGTSYLLVGALISAIGLVKASMDPISGFLSDTLGRKKLASLGSLIMVASLTMITLASSPAHLLAAFVFFGLGQALFFLAMMTSMVEIAGPLRLALVMGIYEGGNGASILIGTALSGFIAANLGLRTVFGVATALTFLSFLVCQLFTVETLVNRSKGRAILDLGGVRELLSREYVTGMFSAFMFMYTQSLFTTVMPLYATLTIGLSVEAMPILFIGLSAANAVGSFVAGPISDRIGRRLPLALGMIILCASFAALPFLRELPSLTVVSLTLGFSSGFFHPVASAVIADISTSEARGKAYGFYRLARDSGYFAGPAVTGVVSSLLGVPSLFILSALLAALGAILSMFVIRETMRRITG